MPTMLVIIFNLYLIAIVVSDSLQNNAAAVLPLPPNVPTFNQPTNFPTQNDPRQDIQNQIFRKLVANAAEYSALTNSPQQNAPRIPDSSPTFEIVQEASKENPPACKNSEALIKVLNKLFDVLKLQNSESKVETVNHQQDLIKKYMNENPKGLQNSELYNKFKIAQEDLETYKSQLLNQKPKLRSLFDDDSKPKFQTKIIFKYQLPSIDQPDCKDAFTKLISIAHDAYLQLSKQPMCKGTTSNQIVWPKYLNPQNQYASNSQEPLIPVPEPSLDTLQNQDMPNNQFLLDILKILYPKLYTSDSKSVPNQINQIPLNQNTVTLQNPLNPNNPLYQNYPNFPNWQYQTPLPSQNNQNHPLDQNNQSPIRLEDNYAINLPVITPNINPLLLNKNPLNQNFPLHQNYPYFPNLNSQNYLPGQNNLNRPLDQNNRSPIPEGNYAINLPLISPNINPLLLNKNPLNQKNPLYQNYPYVPNLNNQNPLPSQNSLNRPLDQNNQGPILLEENYAFNLPPILPNRNSLNKIPSQGQKYLYPFPNQNNENPFFGQNYLNPLQSPNYKPPFEQKNQNFGPRVPIPSISAVNQENKHRVIDIMSILQNYRPNNNTSNLQRYFPSSSYLDKPLNVSRDQSLNSPNGQPLLINNQALQYNVTGYNPIMGDFVSLLEQAGVIAKELKGSDSDPNNKGVNQNKRPIVLSPSNINQLDIPSLHQTYNPNLPNIVGSPTKLLAQNNLPPQSWPNTNQVVYHHDSIDVTDPNPGISKNNLQQTLLNQLQNYLTPSQLIFLKQLRGQNVPLDSPNQKPMTPLIDPYQQVLLQNLIKRQQLLDLQNQQRVILPNQNTPNPFLIPRVDKEKSNNQNLDQYGISNGLMNQQQYNNPNQLQPSLLDLIGLPNQENIRPVSQIPTSVGDITSNFQQQANYPANVEAADAKQWSSVTNLLKLNSLPDKPNIIELTYLLKRPEQFLYQYQPYLFVKYRLAYNTFLLNLRDLLIRKPYLRIDPVKLYGELIPNSNITEVSPDLKNFNEDDIMKIVSQNSAFVDAKFLNSNNTILDEQLKIIQNLTSNLKYGEILNLLDVMINNNIKNKESLEQSREVLNDTAKKQLGNLKSNQHVEPIASNNDIPAEIKNKLNGASRRDTINSTDQYLLPEDVANPRLLHLKRNLQNEKAFDIV